MLVLESLVGESDYDQNLFILIFANYFYLNGIVPILKYLKINWLALLTLKKSNIP